ncbi:MAG: M15 family metallopeptidase [Solirubrobacterales bacterium]|nr:M15 family metallopeptidase [Solirubrobacterales bacterium]
MGSWRTVLLLCALGVLPALAPASTGATSARDGNGASARQTGAGGFSALRDHLPGIIEEMRYTGRHNFVGRPIRGYREPICLLTRQAARALVPVQRTLRRHRLQLKIYDCYRPQRAVDDFVRWARDRADNLMKREFYPRVPKGRLFADGYIAAKSGHSRGSTVDLTIVPRPAGRQQRFRPGMRLVSCTAPRGLRFRDNSIEMGTGFDCFDRRSHTLNPNIRGRAKRNRLLLKRVMNRNGFRNLPEEWWHYTLRNEPFPDTYFNFPVARGSLRGS